MAGSRSLYDVLNVAPEAEPVVIDAAYKALMKKYHPDQAEEGAGRPRDAAEINEAFAILKDPERRSEYDRRLWSKQQALRLAELKAMEPPRRGSKLFGWSGWLVAAAIGCAFAALAVERKPAPALSPAAFEAAAKAEARRVPPEEIAARKAAAAVVDLPEPPSADAIIAKVRARANAPEPQAVRPRRLAAAPARTEPLRSRPARKAAAAPRAKREKADFLEREGYIY